MTERDLLVDCLHVVQFPATAVPLIFHEFSGDFYIEEAAVRGLRTTASIQRYRHTFGVEGRFLAGRF